MEALRMARGAAFLVVLFALAACRGEPPATDVRTVSPRADASTDEVSGTTGPATPASACDEHTTVIVPGAANVFGAGIDELPAPGGGGAGVEPMCVVVPAGASVFTVP